MSRFLSLFLFLFLGTISFADVVSVDPIGLAFSKYGIQYEHAVSLDKSIVFRYAHQDLNFDLINGYTKKNEFVQDLFMEIFDKALEFRYKADTYGVGYRSYFNTTYYGPYWAVDFDYSRVGLRNKNSFFGVKESGKSDYILNVYEPRVSYGLTGPFFGEHGVIGARVSGSAYFTHEVPVRFAFTFETLLGYRF